MCSWGDIALTTWKPALLHHRKMTDCELIRVHTAGLELIELCLFMPKENVTKHTPWGRMYCPVQCWSGFCPFIVLITHVIFQLPLYLLCKVNSVLYRVDITYWKFKKQVLFVSKTAFHLTSREVERPESVRLQSLKFLMAACKWFVQSLYEN